MKRWAVIAGLIIVTALVLVAWRFAGGGNNSIRYRTAKVEKGDLIQIVKATGIIQPVNSVEVGSQVTGRIIKLYADFNSRVKAGDIIAQVDPATYQERMQQDKANLKVSRANIEQIRANLKLADLELQRDRDLAGKDLLSQSDLDASTAKRNALAAQLRAARASYEQNKAALRLSETNLEYCTIRAPTDGIVISRNVSEGQTIVANLQAQTIFVIATDLVRIQVEASIPEADIGKISEGQEAIFTVDAYPDMEFVGEVSQVRIAATTLQNVVTYPVIITAKNPDEKLFPGMTATISIEVAKHMDVIKIPNAALRFRPEITETQFEKEEGGEGQAPEGVEQRGPEVWIMSGKELKPVPVTPGASDGFFTEIPEGRLSPGQEVVVGIVPAGAKDTMVNPFLPTMPRRGRRPSHPPH